MMQFSFHSVAWSVKACSSQPSIGFGCGWGGWGEREPIALLPSNTRTDVLWGLNPLLKKVQSLSLQGGGGVGGEFEQAKKIGGKKEEETSRNARRFQHLQHGDMRDINHPTGMKRTEIFCC